MGFAEISTIQAWANNQIAAAKQAMVVGGSVDGSGNLILTKDDGSTVNAGNVKGPPGNDGVIGATPPVTYDSVGKLVGIQASSTTQPGSMSAPQASSLAALIVSYRQQQAAEVSVASIALGLTANTSVNWPTAFADTNYNVQLTVEAPAASLGILSIPVVVTKTTTGCSISIKNVSLSLGSGAFKINALATHY